MHGWLVRVRLIAGPVESSLLLVHSVLVAIVVNVNWVLLLLIFLLGYALVSDLDFLILPSVVVSLILLLLLLLLLLHLWW